jgi:hypothetical protein
MPPARPSNYRFLTLAIGGPALLLLGLWVAFQYSLATWGPDDVDLSVTVELWRGIQRYGLGFVSSWNYGVDNWLLSILPLTSALYQLFGPRPTLLVAFGWMAFTVSVGLTAVLATMIAGWRWGLAVACVLAFANVSALGPVGFLSHPISHNVSMAWSLVALVLAMQALTPGAARWAWSAATGLAIFVNAVSDPWATVAIALPITCIAAALVVVWWKDPVARRAGLLCVMAFLATAAAYTRAFGLLDFLPQSQRAFADLSTMLANLYWANRALTAMFNIVPGVPVEATASRLVNAAALLGLLGWTAVVTLTDIRWAAPRVQLVSGVALLSMAAVSIVHLILRWDNAYLSPIVGRFFPNIYFFGPLLVVAAAARRWARWRPASKLFMGGYAALLIVSGLASGPQIWLGPAHAVDWGEARELGRFLEQHGLAYGYGPYWGSRSLVMPNATDGRVIIRPVSFYSGRIARRGLETSSHWYGPNAEPAPSRQFLVIRDDGEECPSAAECVAIARRQFGKEAEQLAFRDMLILVWAEPIQSRISSLTLRPTAQMGPSAQGIRT